MARPWPFPIRSAVSSPRSSRSCTLESAEVLDQVAQPLGKAVRGAVSGQPLKDALSGTWLGHAVHPMLTDVVIGSFMSASVLDLLAPDSDGKASERLIALG